MKIVIRIENTEPLPVKDAAEAAQLRVDLQRAVQNTLLRYGAGAQQVQALVSE